MRCKGKTSVILIVLLITLCVSASAQAQPLSQLLSPCITDQTLAVIKLDITRLDVDALFARISEVAAGLVPAEHIEHNKTLLEKRRHLGQTQVAALQAAGVKRLYMTLSPHNKGMALFAVPLQQVDESALKVWIDALSKLPGSRHTEYRRRGNLFIVGNRRDIQHIETVPSAIRAELDKALTGDATLQVAFIPSVDALRILEAMLPAMSNQRLQIPRNALTQGLLWASLAVDFPPRQSAKLRVQSADSQSAQGLKDLIAALCSIVGEIPDLETVGPKLKTTLNMLTPHVNNDTLQLTLNHSQCNRLSSDLLGPGLLALQRRSERSTCATWLSGLGKAMLIHANEFDDQFPPDLETLVRTQELHPKTLCCMGRKKAGASYVYRGVDLGGPNNNQELILVHDRKDNHRKGRNVLFVDDRVDWVAEDQFQELIKRDNLLRRQRGLPEKPAQ